MVRVDPWMREDVQEAQNAITNGFEIDDNGSLIQTIDSHELKEAILILTKYVFDIR